MDDKRHCVRPSVGIYLRVVYIRKRQSRDDCPCAVQELLDCDRCSDNRLADLLAGIFIRWIHPERSVEVRNTVSAARYRYSRCLLRDRGSEGRSRAGNDTGCGRITCSRNDVSIGASGESYYAAMVWHHHRTLRHRDPAASAE